MENQIDNKMLPYDINAEMSVLGSMFLNKEAADVAMGILKYEDFYSSKNAEIYKAISNLTERNEKEIDFVIVADELKKEGKLEFVGNMDYLMELTGFVPGTTNIEAYSKIVKTKAILRYLIKISDEVMSKCYSDCHVDEVLEFVESSIYNISQNQNKSDLEKINIIVKEALQQINEMSLNKGSITGVTTGLEDLNKQISGLQKSDLVLLAARPSMGKTALALNMALSAALDEKKVAIFSLEMSKLQLSQRLLSQLSLVDLQKIISGDLGEEDYDMIINALAIIDEIPLYVDETSSISLTELRSKCRRISAKNGLDLVLIDYLQLMTINGKTENRQQEISTISRGLKALAKELNCPVVALSQLSRAVESRSDKKPMLSDLRESGAIEQDADIVMMLYRDDYYNPESERPNIADLIIAKHRNGPTGIVQLYFNKIYTKFTDLVLEEDVDNYGK